MSIEQRLRDAYQAKTAQLTEARLDQLTAGREDGLDELFGAEHTAELPIIDLAARASRRQHRWIAPTLAAAAVAAVAIGVLVVATEQPTARPKPNPPASHVSSPPTTFSTSTPTPSASATQTVVAPPYLLAGQTGSRDQVPWSIVGSGWRLMQREHATNAVPNYDSSLYLYDPAAGRYLITDSLPANAKLVGWSPDGDRAMVMTYDLASPTSVYYTSVYYQVQLRSGVVNRVLRTGPSNFISYTRPRGSAFLIDAGTATGPWRLYRYSTGGLLEYSYPSVVNGMQVVGGGAFYSSDGSELVVPKLQDGSPVLIGNDGHFIRTFAGAPGYVGCRPVKLWTAGQLLERCTHVGTTQSRSALLVQPLSGGAPRVLADAPARNTDGYWNAWQLSNGDVLLFNFGDCSGSTYDILDAGSGTIRPLRWPPGIPTSSDVLKVSGDVATFLYRTPGGCGEGLSQVTLYSYHLLTGQVTKLFDGNAEIVGWPGDQN